MERIAITSYGAVSALGNTVDEVWEQYLAKASGIKYCSSCKNWVAKIPTALQSSLNEIRNTNRHFQKLDRSVLLAILATAQAIEKVEISDECGINIGSSRGATTLFEQYFEAYHNKPFGKLNPRTSPNTTLGNLASNVANYLGLSGLAMSHSITCSTALHSVLNGVAWLQSGMAQQFLVGGTEAPLTPFTIAQMKALHLYSQEKSAYPCRAMDLGKKQNTMVLGEGAASFLLEKDQGQKAIAYVEGVGYATEKVKHGTSISAAANCLQLSMKMALKETEKEEIDAIIMHSPGTIKGDQSEWKAIQKVFGKNIPFLTTNKWKIGHTLGASGALSMEMAILMLANEKYIEIPFYQQAYPNKLPRKILVNAVGFGGNAVTILLTK